MHVLITGASGFVGSLLVPRLCAGGHTVRALGRDPQRVRSALARSSESQGVDEVEIVRADVLESDLEQLTLALAGIEVAYYLIHSIERLPGAGPSFRERDRLAAENFAAAASRAGVRRIVYLGGLLPRARQSSASSRELADTSISRHLASREDVERVLLAAVPDSLALRASIVIGARSRSFRLLIHLLERMPVLTLPSWHTFRTQPIDERDVIEMLAACATAQLPRRSLDIGGPLPLSYGEMLQTIAELMLINRPTVSLGMKLTGITARVAAAMAGEDPELVVALMEGLNCDLLLSDDHAAELLGVRLHSFSAAVEHALAEWERAKPLAAR
jgi:uncharacterized protein YbjT (DUF2867 family)